MPFQKNNLRRSSGRRYNPSQCIAILFETINLDTPYGDQMLVIYPLLRYCWRVPCWHGQQFHSLFGLDFWVCSIYPTLCVRKELILGRRTTRRNSYTFYLIILRLSQQSSWWTLQVLKVCFEHFDCVWFCVSPLKQYKFWARHSKKVKRGKFWPIRNK